MTTSPGSLVSISDTDWPRVVWLFTAWLGRTGQLRRSAAWVHLLKCMTFIRSYWVDGNGDVQERGWMRSDIGFSPRSWPACQLRLNLNDAPWICAPLQLEAVHLKTHSVIYLCAWWKENRLLWWLVVITHFNFNQMTSSIKNWTIFTHMSTIIAAGEWSNKMKRLL